MHKRIQFQSLGTTPFPLFLGCRGHNQLLTPHTPYLGAMRAQPLSLIAELTLSPIRRGAERPGALGPQPKRPIRAAEGFGGGGAADQ